MEFKPLPRMKENPSELLYSFVFCYSFMFCFDIPHRLEWSATVLACIVDDTWAVPE